MQSPLPEMKTAVAAATPTFGPALISLGGINIPPLPLALAIGSLLLARMIAPPAARKLTRRQEMALTALLIVILFLIVTGELFGDEPLKGGMAMIWGVGLGFSGLLVIEFFGQRVVDALKALLGLKRE